MTQPTPGDERLLDRLLESLLDLPPEERTRRLQRLSATRPALAARLSRLLDFADDERTLGPGGALHGELVAELIERDAPVLAPGTLFCGYRIESAIGRGGMSDVYRATRDYGDFAQVVALKLIHRGKNHTALRSYLEHERRALARLEHPGIARFIDAGEGPDGDLYLAMEYVAGEPILAHAERRRLPLRERIDLLVELCRALEHAHMRRLIHGDVKSANVLVDDTGRLRLVDFGIASGLDGSGERRRAFTPDCAAPEQIAGEEITVATDVYQVGALAYRLLSGRSHRPVTDAGAVTTADEKPSAAATRAPGDASRAHAQSRGLASPRALSSALRGDLDAIVMRCLAAEPEQRYATCGELRDDLQAWRRRRPVRARNGGAWLRLGKFVQRNAVAVSLIALAVIVLIASSAMFLYRLRQTELTRLAEAERAVRVEHFLAELFRTGSPYLQQDGRDPLAIFSELGAALLRESSDMDPRTRARVGLSLAQLQLARGDEAQARVLLDDAQRALGADRERAPLLAAELLGALAVSRSGNDDNDEAIVDQTEALRLLDHARAPALQRALARSQLADLLRRAGRNDEAGRHFAQAMPVVLAAFDPPTLDAIRAIDRYVRFLNHAGDVDALRRLRPALAERVAQVDSNTLADAELTSTLAEIDSMLDGPAAAAAKYQQAAQRFEELLGATHPRVARALADACVSSIEHGEMTTARGQCERALTIYYQASGPESDGVAVASSNLGVIAYNSGALDEADSYAQRAQRLFEQKDQPFQTLFGRMALGRLAVARGRYETALTHLDRADAIRAATVPDNQALLLEIAHQRAFALIGLKQLDRAEEALARTEPALAAMIPADRRRNLAWVQVARAQLAGARGDVAATGTAIDAALGAYEGTPGQNEFERGWLGAELAAAAWKCGARQRAVSLFDEALTRMTPEANGAHWASAWAGARLSGRARDAALDARARRMLLDAGVDTEIVRNYLALR